MATFIKCWEVSEGQKPKELQIESPRLEEHLEDWLERDITMLSTELVIIGRQINNIDLLAVDSEGGLVVIELKRDKLPREAIAQAIDYAAHVSTWSPTMLMQVAEDYFSKSEWIGFGSLEDVFAERFEKDLEDISLNVSQRIILVGVRAEPGFERMAEWLSENGVDINAALFSFHKFEDARHVLARTFTISEQVRASRSAAKSGRRPPISPEEFEECVSENELVQHVEAFLDLHSCPVFREMWGLEGLEFLVEIPREGKRSLPRKAIQLLALLSKPGVLKVGISTHNLAERFGLSRDKIEDSLREFPRDPKLVRFETELESPDQARNLVSTILSVLDIQPE